MLACLCVRVLVRVHVRVSVSVCVSFRFAYANVSLSTIYPFVLMVSLDGQFFCLCFELTHAGAAALNERARSATGKCIWSAKYNGILLEKSVAQQKFRT